jgi:transporter family-2 protein
MSGAAMALQGTFNAALGKVVGIWQSTLVVHVIGLLTVVVVIMALGVNWQTGKLTEVPWYAYLGGIMNVIIIYAVVRTMPQIGVGNATTAIIVAQILTALLIDNSGAFGMKQCDLHMRDLLGVLLLAAGARILLMD